MITTKTVSTTIEILGKLYPIRCAEAELPALQEAAMYLNQKMVEIQESGKVINLERIAIITALNISHQFLQLDQQKTSLIDKINQRIAELQNKIETAINQPLEMELIDPAE